MVVQKLMLNSEPLASKFLGMHDPPKQLYIRGNFDNALFERPAGAIVGSRKASAYGRSVTEKMSAELSRAGLIIVSGLALGTDSIAHQACINAGGTTIAVLPSGIERIYPASHRRLADDIIASGGALISEYPGAEQPQKYNFIARNRIIAALSDAILIPEASQKSGSLHTAGFGLDLGRTICAVPGSIFSATSSGTNQLIKNGAIVVTESVDVLDAMGLKSQKIVKPKGFSDSAEEQIILDLLRRGEQSGAELQLLSKLSPSQFLQTLTMLEVMGKIRSIGNDFWALS